jgi:hypothetical protein
MPRFGRKTKSDAYLSLIEDAIKDTVFLNGVARDYGGSPFPVEHHRKWKAAMRLFPDPERLPAAPLRAREVANALLRLADGHE